MKQQNLSTQNIDWRLENLIDRNRLTVNLEETDSYSKRNVTKINFRWIRMLIQLKYLYLSKIRGPSLIIRGRIERYEI